MAASRLRPSSPAPSPLGCPPSRGAGPAAFTFLVALRLGELLGFDEAARAGLYHSSLTVWVGCHIDAYEQAKWFGDDLALKGDFRFIDATGTAPLKYVASHLGAGHPLLVRAADGGALCGGRSP
jgi:hypothetical protein